MFLALQSYVKSKANISVLIRSDNCKAIAYLNKLGSPLRYQLYLLTLEIWVTVVLGGLPLSPSAWTPPPGGLIGALR